MNSNGQRKSTIFLLGLSILFLFFGIILGQKKLVIVPSPSELSEKMNKFWLGMGSTKVPTLKVNIDIDQLILLNESKSIAKSFDLLNEKVKRPVSAKVNVKGRVYRAKMRLKGDVEDHYGKFDDKWSFKVNMKGEGRFLGFKEFSLQHPATRGYLNELTFHHFLRKMGIISLRYKLVNLEVNAKNLGIYLLEEHFNNDLLRSNEKQPGPIVKFDETFMWAHEKIFGYDPISDHQTFSSTSVGSFGGKKNKDLSRAFELLSKLQSSNPDFAVILDLKEFAHFVAVIDLFAGVHALRWHNLRFYYDIQKDKLVPVAFDGNTGGVISRLSINLGGRHQGVQLNEKLYNGLFSNEEFLSNYIQALLKISQQSYLAEAFKELAPIIQNYSAVLQDEFPGFDYSFKSIVERNAEIIRSHFKVERLVLTYLNPDKKNELGIVNLSSLPIKIVRVLGKSQKINIDSEIIYPQHNFQNASRKIIKLDEPLLGVDYKIEYKVFNTRELFQGNIKNWPFNTPFRSLKFDGKEKNLGKIKSFHQIELLELSKDENILKFKPGKLIIDKKYEFGDKSIVVGPGTHLLFKGSGAIFSEGPVQIAGTQENPVVIEIDETVGDSVINLRNGMVSIENLAILDNRTISKQPLMVFQENKVSLRNSIAQKLAGTLDFLNSEVSLDNLSFKNPQLRPLNFKYSLISADNLYFENAKNGALEFIGSGGKILNVDFNGVLGTALANFDSSRILIENARFNNVVVGVKNINGSIVFLNQFKLFNTQIGFESRNLDDLKRPSIVVLNSKAQNSIQNVVHPSKIVKPSTIIWR